jgi:serine/threonine-protein kinase RsbW
MADFHVPDEMQRLRTEADYMRFLVAAGELLSSSLDFRSTLANVCVAAVETVADLCILQIGSLSDIELVGAAHRQTHLNARLLEDANKLSAEAGRPAHPICHVLDTGQVLFVQNIDDEWITNNAANRSHESLMRSLQFRSMLVVPVRSLVWGIAGALTLVRTGQSDPYDEDAVGFAEDLGRRCGIAIGKARLHSQTIDVARRFQKAALPDALPQLRDIEFDGFYDPADAALMLGGDWYDAFLLRNGDIGISVGDVSGHGLNAAALMSSIRNALRMAIIMEDDLSKVLEVADFVFSNEAPAESFCTAVVARVERNAGRMRIATAGHPGPLLYSRGSVRAPVLNVAPPLGYIAEFGCTITTTEIELQPGTTAVFFTDGLLEWNRDPLGGESAVRSALLDPNVRNAANPARAIRDACISGAHGDDVALLTMRYKGNA